MFLDGCLQVISEGKPVFAFFPVLEKLGQVLDSAVEDIADIMV